ncbi:MAG: penicillin-binding transpeptidase domain-containing protein [Anaerovibrio sp.]|uniref:penicillin-binding protein n=1 Tax=Anaerovibrio sp. TaxID=1872532 RepID=UPI00261197CA|nr:penicillin-binding transpeptidase domain-containing protein [Anaerovibrio sp.]MDD7677023.1 penicillin-binding transpeptidase domain-containing protein [Anaerovibrio sp.]MDY2603730.1 penicillin-binding transpeptidase domain-containing protein [Anaerovibrio sp.]
MKKQRHNVQLRISWLLLVIWICFGLLLVRFAWLQLVDGDELAERAITIAEENRARQSPRGKILDRNGRELAISRMAKSLVINPSKVKPEDRENLVAQLSEILKLKPEEIREDIDTGGVFVYVKRRLEVDEENAIKELKEANEYECLELHDEVKRYYPNDMLAANVLGFIGTDDKGLAGMEQYADELLKGEAQEADLIIDMRGRPIFDSIFSAAQQRYKGDNSKNITLTIDSTMQFIVEQSLDKAMADNNPKAVTAVVMDPRTGDVLAMASRPSYNPNKFWQANDEAWRNRAISSVYEPGSTFKAMVAGTALQEGVVAPNMTFYDPGHIDVSEKRIQNWNGESFGNVTFTDIVKNSINTCFAQIGLWLGGEKLNEYAEKFGFGQATGIELPGEESGILFANPKEMVSSDVATMAIGHSIAVTPLQLVTAMSAVANDGVLLKPHIIKQITNADGSVYKEYGREEVHRVIDSATDKTLVGLLEQVVATGGGSKAAVKGYRIAGKTGTAQKINEHTSGYMEGRYIASFCGFAPVENPELVVLVVIDDPSAGSFYGGQIAAPVARDIFSQLFRFMHISPSSDTFADMNKDKETTAARPAPAASDGKVRMPDLTGMSIRDVSQKLAELGLGIDVQGNGLARSQSIPAGAEIKSGQSVTVTFSP